jgi:hypothetical protein
LIPIADKLFYLSFPKNGNIWITTRVDLFNEKVKKKEIPNRIKHFLDFYLEPDGRIINLKVILIRKL